MGRRDPGEWGPRASTLRLLVFAVVTLTVMMGGGVDAQLQDVHSLKGPFTLPFWSMQGGKPAPPLRNKKNDN